MSQEFGFELVLADVPEMTDEVASRLYEAGCHDCSPGSCDGVSTVAFDREAESLEEAVRSAIADVQSAGYQVERIVTDDVETIERLNRELQTVA